MTGEKEGAHMSFSTVKSAAMEGLAVEMVYVEAGCQQWTSDFSHGGISVIRGERSSRTRTVCSPEFRS